MQCLQQNKFSLYLQIPSEAKDLIDIKIKFLVDVKNEIVLTYQKYKENKKISKCKVKTGSKISSHHFSILQKC